MCTSVINSTHATPLPWQSCLMLPWWWTILDLLEYKFHIHTLLTFIVACSTVCAASSMGTAASWPGLALNCLVASIKTCPTIAAPSQERSNSVCRVCTERQRQGRKLQESQAPDVPVVVWFAQTAKPQKRVVHETTIATNVSILCHHDNGELYRFPSTIS